MAFRFSRVGNSITINACIPPSLAAAMVFLLHQPDDAVISNAPSHLYNFASLPFALSLALIALLSSA